MDAPPASDKRLALLARIRHRRQLLSHIALAREACQRSSPSMDERSWGKMMAAVTLRKEGKAAATLVNGRQRGSRALQVVKQEAQQQQQPQPRNLENHERKKKRRSSTAAVVAPSASKSSQPEMELSSHASFAILRRDQLQAQLILPSTGPTMVLPIPCQQRSTINTIDCTCTTANTDNARKRNRLPYNIIRKKTHYDVVLQEMRHMAQDYMSERQWKISLGRSFVDAFLSRATAKADNNVDTNNDKVSIVEGRMTITTPSSKRVPSLSKLKRLNDTAISTCALYHDQTIAEMDCVKTTSNTLSTRVDDYWYQIRQNSSITGGRNHPVLNNKEDTTTLFHKQTFRQQTPEEMTRSVLSTLEYLRNVKQSILSNLDQTSSSSLSCSNGNDTNVLLSTTQQCAYDYVIRLWDSKNTSVKNVGAVLNGDFGSGKTAVCSALIHRRQCSSSSEKLQVILCPVGSLHRWKHELNKFHMTSYIISNTTDLQTTVKQPSSPNILLLDYHSFTNVDMTDLLLSASCIYIDLRHTNTTTMMTYSELFLFYTHLLVHLQKCKNTRRLFIDFTTCKDSTKGNETLSEYTKRLALKMACVYDLYTSGKCIVSWIHCERNALNPALELNIDICGKNVEFFSAVLEELLSRASFTMKSSSEEVNWEVLRVGDTEDNVGGVIHAVISSFGPSLRRTIFTSEPNVEVGTMMMDKLPKLKKLLKVLNEYYGVGSHPSLDTVDNIDSNGHKSIMQTDVTGNKVFILVSSQEARSVTSFFLCCVGIRNEVLEMNSPAAWDRVQNVIARFNGNDERKTLRILLSSPMALSSLNGGLCPAANAVIYIDEGCNHELHLASLSRKICCANQNGNACRFIKISDECNDGNDEGFSNEKLLHVISTVQNMIIPQLHSKKGAFQQQLSPSSYGLFLKSRDNQWSKVGKLPPPRSDIQHYARSLYTSQLSRQTTPTQQRVQIGPALKKTVPTSQKTKKSGKNSVETDAPRTKSTLLYDISSAASICGTNDVNPDNHLYAQEFYPARDHILSAVSGSSRGFQPLVYLPLTAGEKKRKPSADTLSNTRQKRLKVRADDEFIETTSYSGYNGESTVNDPTLNSIILVAQEEISDNGSSLFNNTSSTDDKKLMAARKMRKSAPYFTKDRPLRRAVAIRDVARFNHNQHSPLVARSVKLRSWLSNSVTVQSPVQSFASFMMGIRAEQNHVADLLERQNCVSTKMLPAKNTGPTSENNSWTERDMQLMQRGVSQYGNNWQLVARGLSAPNFYHHPFSDAVPLRSPNQCKLQWKSSGVGKLESMSQIASTGATTINLISVPGIEGESFIQKLPSDKSSGEQQNVSQVHWIQSNSFLVNHVQSTNINVETVGRVIASLKQSSKKRHDVKIPIPGSTAKLEPVHLSHREAVQAVTTTSMPREMWPMELIEHKSREEAAAAAQQHSSRMSLQYNGTYTRAVVAREKHK